MKRRQKFITTLSLMVALTAQSPVVGADAGGAVPLDIAQPAIRKSEPPLRYTLTSSQLDGVHAGRDAMEIFVDIMANWGVKIPAGCYGGYGGGCVLPVTPN